MQPNNQLTAPVLEVLAAIGVRAALVALDKPVPESSWPEPSQETGGRGLSQLARIVGNKPIDDDYRPTSPLSGDQTALSPNAPRFPDDFPSPDWVQKVRDHATGETTSKFMPSAEAKQVKEDRKALAAVLANAGTDEQKGVQLGLTFSGRMRAEYTGRFEKSKHRPDGAPRHPEEATLQRSIIAIEALLASGLDLSTPQGRTTLNSMVMTLNADERKQLLMADELSGRRIYSALYLAAKDDVSRQPSFSELKTTAQQARVGKQLNAIEPSGTATSLVTKMLGHLDESDIPLKERQAVVDKLAFKMRIRPGQGANADIPTPDTTQPGWQDKFSARLLSVAAESPELSDESLRKMLDMPVPDLLKVMSHAFTGSQPPDMVNDFSNRREGDFRIIRVMREMATGQVSEGAEGWREVSELLDRLETGEFDRVRFMELAGQGMAMPQILTTLRQETALRATQLSGEFTQRLQHHRNQRQLKRQEAVQELQVAQQNNNQAQVRELQAKIADCDSFLAETNGFDMTPERVAKLLKHFGRNKLQPASLGDLVYKDFKRITEVLENPARMKAGLDRSSLMLPTAGKELKDFPWLASTVDEMLRIAKSVREVEPEFSLKPYPIIILDQTDGNGNDPAKVEKWQRNAQYIAKLKKQYAEFGLEIEHVSMGNIRQMIQGSGVEKMFDTTGELNPGYGGARNMAFLLTPVIRDAVRKGEKVSELTSADLKQRIRECSLKNTTKVFQGDDTDYVGAGGILANVASTTNDEFNESYTFTQTFRGGRDTTGVNDGYTYGQIATLEQDGVDSIVSKLFSANRWDTLPKKPGMGCTFGSPRHCLDLPSGAEEAHNMCTTGYTNVLSRNDHLSGDRQAPTAEFMKNFISYSTMTEVVKNLFSSGQLPWNSEATDRKENGNPMGSLKEVLETTLDVDKRKTLQKDFLTKLVDFETNPNSGLLKFDQDLAGTLTQHLATHPEVDAETRDEMQRVAEVYRDAERQAKLAKRLLAGLFQALTPGVNDANQRKNLLGGAVDADPDQVLARIRQVRRNMENEDPPVRFDASNRMVRDLFLMIESLGGGGFCKLSETLLQG